MDSIRRRAMGAGFLLLGVWAFASLATSVEGIPERQPGREDAGPRLHISTKSKTFHIGQVIPLELSFTSATPNRYLINMARYDRSGRMNYEQFVVSPSDGTRDPLRLYFNSIWGYLGGGLTGYKDLSLTPTLIHLNLNEWVSFDKPGKYELQVISRRVSDVEASRNSYVTPVELKSNVIELQISLPDAAWQGKQLAGIIESLDRAVQPEDQSSHDPYWAALTALRFLGTKGAARELARRLRGENVNVDWQCMFGLIGSPNRAAGLEEMNKLLEDPAFPVGEMFLNTMSILPLDPDAPPGALLKEHAENLAALRQRLASAVDSKQGRALAVSLNTVMRGQKLSPELRSRLVPQLIRVFSELSLENQLEWLRFRWNQIRNPGWIPTLRAMALRYEDFPLVTEMHAFQSLQVSGEALVRWYGLDPKGARSAVIAEITRPKPRYNARILGILPDKTLPAAEYQIAAHFLDGNNFQVEGNLASLLFRYADAAVLPEVLGKVDERVGKWACEPQDTTLAYVLKVNPSAAGPLIERAIQARGPGHTACRHMLLTDIGRLESSPVLEKLAVKSLDDPDPQVAANAAGYLGAYGSADVEPVLWKHYEDWCRKWSGRWPELRYVPGRKNPDLWQANLGQSLAHALAMGQAWLAGEPMLHRIQAMGVGPNIRQDMAQALEAWKRRPLAVRYISSEPLRFSVAQYNLPSLKALETKLAQFPRGTEFYLPPAGPNAPQEEQAALQRVLTFATANGLVVTRAPRP